MPDDRRSTFPIRRMTRGCISAFTLAELLTVIAVIGILAALSLAALSSASQTSRQVYCVNNVRQLELALQQFMGENRVYPLAQDTEFDLNGQPTRSTTWVDALNQQLGDKSFGTKGVWLCPGVKSKGILGQSFMSYGYNAFGAGANSNSLGLGGTYGFPHTVQFGPTGIPILKPPINQSAVVSPSDMMAIGDGFHGSGSKIFGGQGFLWRHDGYVGFSDTTTASYARHQGKANVAFCDGHIESPKLQFLFTDTSDKALVRWNRDHLPHREQLEP
jgi:prepilin-type processing-associated H-X9-DG protein/prepilin-type N-terminal cleavage/methylation domain-containing protein